MIDLTKYDFTDEDIEFLNTIKKDIELENEIYLQYGDMGFVIEPFMNKLNVYTYGEEFGIFDDFDDLFSSFKINGVPLIELVKELNFAQ